MSKDQVKVLIVDDSAVVRETLRRILNEDPRIRVLGTASDPVFAVEMIAQEVPDVITLDIEMPRMDGLSFLQRIMSQHPIPVVICSSLVSGREEATLRALELGAVEIIAKPKLGTRTFLEESRVLLCDAVKAAAQARVRKLTVQRIRPKLSADVILAPSAPKGVLRTTDKVVVVGASTGGTEAIRVFLEAMPLDCPGIAIVQHMPEKFTASFAQRLDRICGISVKEAENGDPMMQGHALIAPGNRHLLLKRSGAKYYVEIRDGPLVSRHRPSVDVLFRSAARYAWKNAVGVILTGMGDDGAKGLLELRQAGATTLAQDEESSVVFGMPNEAIKCGAAEEVVSPHRMARRVRAKVHRVRERAAE